MCRVFVIPDIHLKPWMFDKASGRIKEGKYDFVLLLGDLVDDWGQETNVNLYKETFETAIDFVKQHSNTLYCFGNHEMGYIYEEWVPGHSGYADHIVKEKFKEFIKALPADNSAYIHRIDEVLFSHGGVTERFIHGYFGKEDIPDIDSIIRRVNKMGKLELWDDDSPLWARPQNGRMKLYPDNLMQIVGHTPVEKPLHEGNLLTVDTFGFYKDGRQFGNQEFIWIDTVTRKYGII